MMSHLPRSLFALAARSRCRCRGRRLCRHAQAARSRVSSPTGVYSFSTPAPRGGSHILYGRERTIGLKLGYKYSRYFAVEGEVRRLRPQRLGPLLEPRPTSPRGSAAPASAWTPSRCCRLALLVLRPHGRLPRRCARRLRLWLHGRCCRPASTRAARACATAWGCATTSPAPSACAPSSSATRRWAPATNARRREVGSPPTRFSRRGVAWRF